MSTDYFLKLDPKVEGESTDAKHKGEIEIEWLREAISWVDAEAMAAKSQGTITGEGIPRSKSK